MRAIVFMCLIRWWKVQAASSVVVQIAVGKVFEIEIFHS